MTDMNQILSACMNEIKLTGRDPKQLRKVFVCVIDKTTYFDETDRKTLKSYFDKNRAGLTDIKSFKALVKGTLAYLSKRKDEEYKKQLLHQALDYDKLLSYVFDKGTHTYTTLKKALGSEKYRSYLPKHRLPTVASALVYAEKLKKLLLKEDEFQVISVLFLGVLLFIRGNLFCEFCGQWKDGTLLFETMRCIFDTKFLLRLKTKHLREKQWDKVGVLYTRLFDSLYEDIMPASGDIASVEEEIASTCWGETNDQRIFTQN